MSVVDPLCIFTAGATREGLALCRGRFEAATGFALEAHTTHGHLIREQVLAGEVDDDVVLLPAAMVDDLVAAGRAAADDQVALGVIRIGAGVRAGVAVPDVSTMAGFTRAVTSAGSIVITEAPSGVHMDRVFADLGLADSLADRIVRYDTGTMVNEHLVSGARDDEIAFGVATELLFFRDRGVAYAGPLPDDIQMLAEYRAARLTRSDRIGDCRALFAFLATDEARRQFAMTGVDIG